MSQQPSPESAEPSFRDLSAADSSSADKVRRLEGEQSAGQRRAYGAWSASSKPAGRDIDDRFKTFPEELAGLIAMANQACRKGVGDLLWFAYRCAKQKGRKKQPGIGSLLVGVTTLGARIMKEELAKCEPEHWDAFYGGLDAQ